MPFSMAEVALDLEDVFYFFFNNVGVYTYYSKGVTATLPATSAPKTSLILVFFASLALVDRKLLMLATRYVSKKSVNELSFFEVFFLFFCKPVLSKTL